MPAAPGINFLALLNPELAAKQNAIAQQQAMAAQLLQQGSTPIDPTRTAGRYVVPISPLEGLGKAGQSIAGALIQRNANQQTADLYKTLAQPTDGSAPAQATPPGGPLLAAAAGGTVTGNPNMDTMFLLTDPSEYMKSLATRNMPTDLAKNVGNPATMPYIAKDKLVTGAGGVPVPADYVMQRYQMPAPIPPTPAAAAIPASPASPPPPTTDAQGTPQAPANMDDLLNQQSNAPFPGPQGGAVPLKTAAYDPLNPVANDRTKGLIEGDTKYLNETLLPAKDAAQAANANLDALTQASTIANANDLTHTGPTAPQRLNFIKHLNDFLASTGGNPLDTNEIANADAINKIGLRLTANMTKMLGSREAAQIFTKIQEANPNWYMQPKTLNLVTSLIKGENDTAIGKYLAAFDTVKKGGLAQDGVNAYESQNPGAANVKKAFSTAGMAGFADPRDPAFAALPSGTPFFDLNPQSPTYGKQLVKH